MEIMAKKANSPTTILLPKETDGIKTVTGKERKLFLKKINKLEQAYLDQIKTYSRENGIITGYIFSCKKDLKITAVTESDINTTERLVRKLKGTGERIYAHCAWSGAEEVVIGADTSAVFLDFYCVMITDKEGFMFSKFIIGGRSYILFEGDCDDYKETIDSFKKKWKHLQ